MCFSLIRGLSIPLPQVTCLSSLRIPWEYPMFQSYSGCLLPRDEAVRRVNGLGYEFQSYSGCLLPRDRGISHCEIVKVVFQSYSGCLLPRDPRTLGLLGDIPLRFNPTQDACFPATSQHALLEYPLVVSILLRMLASPRRRSAARRRDRGSLFQSYSGCLLPRDAISLACRWSRRRVSILLRMLASPRLR